MNEAGWNTAKVGSFLCTRRLKELARRRGNGIPSIRQHWWAERGSRRWINDDDSLETATLYVRDYQDKPH
jgi:hypothetical protein